MTKNELRLILEKGEGYEIEFKELLSNIDKTFVAFANFSGGRVFLGISDKGKVIGAKITNRLKSQVQDTADNCQPRVEIHLEEIEDVLVIDVREGEDKPYKCSSGFYIRVGPNSQKLSRNEIIEFFKAEGKIRFDELINPRFDYDTHFDQKKLDKFLRLAGISKVLETSSILVNLGVAEKQEGKVILNNTGILFFSKDLQDIYFHTAVTCALYKGTKKIDVLDRRDFNEDVVSNIDRAMNFLKQYIPVRYEMTGMPRRKEIPEIPYDALREAIINAVAHRDYFEKGSNVMVEIFDDRIEITNFGGLPKGLKPEDFGKKSVLRNANIADLLHRIEYIEKMGTGINKMRELVAEAGLPEIKFEFGTFFTAIFARPKKITPKTTPKTTHVGTKLGLSRDQVAPQVPDKYPTSTRQVIAALAHSTQGLPRAALQDIAGLADREHFANEHLQPLLAEGLIEMTIPDKPRSSKQKYRLTEKGKKMLDET